MVIFISNFKGISLINMKAGNFFKDFSFKIEKGFSFLNFQICPNTIFERFGTITEFSQKPYLRESEPYANLPKTIFDFWRDLSNKIKGNNNLFKEILLENATYTGHRFGNRSSWNLHSPKDLRLNTPILLRIEFGNLSNLFVVVFAND